MPRCGSDMKGQARKLKVKYEKYVWSKNRTRLLCCYCIGLFVTVDPQRDSATILKEYMTNYDSHIIALTGTEDQILDTINKFKVYAKISPLSKPNSNDYLIDHTTFIYLMDKNGQYVKFFRINDTAEDIVEYIRIYTNKLKAG